MIVFFLELLGAALVLSGVMLFGLLFLIPSLAFWFLGRLMSKLAKD